MRLNQDAEISDEKLTRYLLTSKKRNDKSKWLAQAGYVLENWAVLKDHLRRQVLPQDARLVETTEYGKMYEIRADLEGPNGTGLPVCTIWLVDTTTGTPRFITMYPDRKKADRDEL